MEVHSPSARAVTKALINLKENQRVYLTAYEPPFMNKKLKALLPKPEELLSNRWLRWMGPVLHQPELWRFTRRSVAVGLSLGIFFGFLVPVGQIPLAVGVSVVLRGNLPVAAISTLVSNPVTYAPIYYAGYKLGKKILGEAPPKPGEAERMLKSTSAEFEDPDNGGLMSRLSRWFDHMGTYGLPLMLGLGVMALVGGLSSYVLVLLLWALRTRWHRRQRLLKRKP